MWGVRMGILSFSNGAVKRVEGMLVRMAQGDFTAAASGGKLVHPLFQLTTRTFRGLKSMLEIVERASKQLHVRIEDVNHKSDVIAEQVNSVTMTVRDITSGVQDAAYGVQASAEQLARIQTHLEQLAQMNRQVGAAGEEVAECVRQGSREMEEASTQLQRIDGESTVLLRDIGELNEAVGQIAAITRFIEEISAQTQLLALNANIEAARAGESGRGFAVVAGEISRLAIQTKEATANIHAQIAGVTSSTSHVRRSSQAMSESVGQGVAAMEAAVGTYRTIDQFLTGMTDSLEQGNERLDQIAVDASSISDSFSQTSALIEEIAAGSQEMLASAEVQLGSIQEMNRYVQEAALNSLTLRSVVSQFKLPNRNSGHPVLEELHRFVDCAMAVRAVMVSMIDERDLERIREWNRKRRERELDADRQLDRIAGCLSTERERERLDEIRKAWRSFGEARDRNAAWMLEGAYDQAKLGLTGTGRERFRSTMELIEGWLESIEASSEVTA